MALGKQGRAASNVTGSLEQGPQLPHSVTTHFIRLLICTVKQRREDRVSLILWEGPWATCLSGPDGDGCSPTQRQQSWRRWGLRGLRIVCMHSMSMAQHAWRSCSAAAPTIQPLGQARNVVCTGAVRGCCILYAWFGFPALGKDSKDEVQEISCTLLRSPCSAVGPKTVARLLA